jgi:hypothetical protein
LAPAHTYPAIRASLQSLAWLLDGQRPFFLALEIATSR